MSATAERIGSQGRLSERAYDHVRRGILSGDIPVGSIISDGQVADELGMSKTPVRQALRLLAQEGLLETGPRRQLVVRGVSAEQRAEVREVREALEGIAVAHACRSMAIDDVDQLRLNLFRQRRAAEAGDDAAFIELDEQFHLALASGAGLATLERLLAQLRGFVRLMRVGTARAEGHLFEVLAEHERILDAVEKRDETAALAALREHLHTSEYRMAQAAQRP